MTLAVALAATVMTAAPASAHHSFAMFDQKQRLPLVGVVKEFQFTNPHSWIQLVVSDGKGGTVEWAIEALSPNVLGRAGWKRNTLKGGDKVTVLVNPLRNGKPGGNLLNVTLADGSVMNGGAGGGA